MSHAQYKELCDPANRTGLLICIRKLVSWLFCVARR